ncbi:MFS transporter [Frankia sp. AiPa1]|uniref:MFS transporter n=1 Tax=Frankia sp. AiPa1 TaxID=573492 RepID=UPI00202AD3A6|nr:MFS transporter [Frankia sp. AiPa1]MCL9760440.1 MFS transporter [Frankia sp. AiPa1]
MLIGGTGRGGGTRDIEYGDTEQVGERRRRSGAASGGNHRVVLWLLLGVVLLSSSAYGVLLLLGPFVKTVGGTEQTYGALCAAAAIPTAIALALLLRFPRTVPPNLLLAGSCLVYTAAAVLTADVHSQGAVLVVSAIVLGTAWAVTYTAAPMIASDLSDDRNRATLIGYATGTIQAGFGIGPVLGNALRDAGMSYQQVFLVGAGLAFGAALLVVPLTVQLRRLPSPGAYGGRADEPATPAAVPAPRPARPAAAEESSLRRMLRSPSVVPLTMVLLSACVFTTMNSFQTTFADSRHLDFDIFYVTYTIAVIAVRLGLARMLSDSASDRVVAVTTVGMTAASVAFVFVGSSTVLYCLASLLLGCTYGLGLPAFQARAVNLAGPAERVRMLPMAGLLFEVAILAFPIAAGAVVDAHGYRGLFVLLICITGVVTALGQIRGGAQPHGTPAHGTPAHETPAASGRAQTTGSPAAADIAAAEPAGPRLG